jgi:hypothetical protein
MNGLQATVLTVACIGLLTGAFIYGVPQDAQTKTTNAADEAPLSQTWADPVLVPDMQGDARDHGIHYLDSGSQCRFGCGRPPEMPGPVPEGLQGSLPAPYFDIIAAGFLGETPTTVQVMMRVASLAEGYPFLSPTPQTTRGVDYIVCFEAQPGERCAMLNVVPQRGGAMTSATFHVFSKVCGGRLENDVRSARPTVAPFKFDPECAFEVPASVTFGAPATIVFDVPKTLANFDAISTPWTSVRANVSHFWLQPATQSHGSFSLNLDSLPNHHDHFGPVYPSGIADELPPTSTDIRFSPATTPLAPVVGPVANANPGLAFGDARPVSPIFDLLSTSLRDEGPEIVVTQTFAGLSRAGAPDFEHGTTARLDNGALFEFGFFHQGEKWHAYAGSCIHFHCANSSFIMLPVRLIEGTPGHLEFRAPREYFGNPGPGTRLTFLMTTTQEINAAYYFENGKENVHTMTFIDQHLGARPFTFTHQASEAKVVAHKH